MSADDDTGVQAGAGTAPGISSATAESAPTPEEVLADIVTPPEEAVAFEEIYDQRFSAEAVEREWQWTRLAGLRDHFRHKGNWSWFLMGLMAFMVLFQSWLIWMVGGGWWDFTHYDWLLPTLMIQYLLQVAGLALVAVRSLFRDLN